MCVGAGNKSSRDPCLPRCRNEAVTRKRGRISARCGLISQGSWPGIERLCHCCTAAAAATAGFLQKKKKKGNKRNQTRGPARTVWHVCLWREVVKWPSPAQPQRPSISTSQSPPQTATCPLPMRTCRVKKIKQQQGRSQLDKNVSLSHHI